MIKFRIFQEIFFIYQTLSTNIVIILIFIIAYHYNHMVIYPSHLTWYIISSKQILQSHNFNLTQNTIILR